jgi:molybdenum cofactor cytidylyltransferase
MEPNGGIGAVVLAAGLARRFGRSKLLADFAGRPVVSHVLDTATMARRRGLLTDVVLVVAEIDRQIQDVARRSETITVINPDPAAGLSRSLALGLAALPPDLDAALVLLGDQPLVRTEVIETLLHTWRIAGSVAVRPRYAAAPDAPGHPVLLSRRVWPLAEQLQGDFGYGRRFAPGSPGVTMVDVPGDNPDIDTPADLLMLRDRTE